MGKSGTEKSLSSNIVHYVSSNVFRQVLSFITNFIRPRFLSPEQFGLWNLLNLLPSYSTYSHLGSRSTMQYLVPFHAARGNSQDIREIMGSAYYGSLAVNLVITAGATAVAFFAQVSTEARIGLVTMAVVTILTWRFEFFLAQLKCFQQFRTLAASHYLRATATFFLTLLVIPFQLYGAFAATVLSLIVALLFLSGRISLPRNLVFRFSRYRELVSRGIPILLVGGYVELMRSTDKLIISFFLGKDQLGFYGLAATVIGFLSQIPGASREVLEPRMMADLDRMGTEESVREYFLKPLATAIFYMPLLSVPIYFLAGPTISFALPRYVAAILPCKILALGVYFVALTYLFRGIIVASHVEYRASLYLGAALLANAAITATLLLSGFGIVGVAAGNNVSGFILFVMLLFLVAGVNPAILKHRALILGFLAAATSAALLFIFSLELLHRHVKLGAILLPIVQTAIFCLGWISLTQIVARKTPLVAKIRVRWSLQSH